MGTVSQEVSVTSDDDASAAAGPWRQTVALEDRLQVVEDLIARLCDVVLPDGSVRATELVISGGDGAAATPTVTLQVGTGYAVVEVRVATEGQGRSGVTLYAGRGAGGADDDGPGVGVQLWGGGNCLVELDAAQGADGRWSVGGGGQ